MNLRCSFCNAKDQGTEEELLDRGWARARIAHPEPVLNVVACSIHLDEFCNRIEEHILSKNNE